MTGARLLAGTVAAQLARDSSFSDSRATTAAAASGTYPSHGSAHSWIAAPGTLSSPRNFRANASSAGEIVKYRISLARAGSGNLRSCGSSSSENTSMVATGAPSSEEETPSENT